MFIYNWYQDRQKKEEVESTINFILDEELPLSYDRVIFANKKQEVFNHIYHLAEIGDESYFKTNNSDYLGENEGFLVAVDKTEYI